VDRHLFVIFGATGDLARRKLLPALYTLVRETGLGERAAILGVATTDMDDDAYREWATDALRAAGHDEAVATAWCSEFLHYQQIGRDPSGYPDLRDRIEHLEAVHDLPGNRVFYLALPPGVFATAIEGLGTSGLNRGPGWTRLVIEKPFGQDLETAQSLNRVVHRHFAEEQVYRIDHYLGKETVQNLLVFRFSNPLFERAWNRDRVQSIQITVAEDLGIGTRADFYEQAGALRDIVQNHVAQVLSLIAMSPPIVLEADEIRNEKLRVLRAIRPIAADDVVFGQYATGDIDGQPVPGYREEDGVAPDSATETSVAMRLFIDTWRWAGVPFYIRTGKRFPQRLTQVVVTFQTPPMCLFHGVTDSCEALPNVLKITLQPDEGFDLLFDVKDPVGPGRRRRQSLRFRYEDAVGPLPEAYQTLLQDVVEGDQTLFVRADEAEASWRRFDPVLASRPEVHPYLAGTWGPPAADDLLGAHGHRWFDG